MGWLRQKEEAQQQMKTQTPHSGTQPTQKRKRKYLKVLQTVSPVRTPTSPKLTFPLPPSSIVAKEYHTAQASSLSMRKKLSKSDQAHLAHASGPELEDMIQRYVDEAASQQEKMKKEGSKAERNMSKFLDNFNGYFQAYAGVIGIIKGAGFGQGEAAYGALQVLLIVSMTHLYHFFHVYLFQAGFWAKCRDRQP
jgi:hypothetical protein